ncbi:glycosyltransferase involved in cell wall biosynthesis [Mycobacterium frederiksbergense]|uniref:Glycosyltransferase involved in cell wall biosynthesis n=1 Tax=Mycolicibacterium frederiksbergense TaxID=117567 RepID=A0ABT6L1H6_9MYCO|nr:glycosyltransferase [Mycolicibacterium frederiksbergense]MDH6196789.1 glycosyltransferase involved in cell wall biosynthesis [Mycolicibacterium frederiksbergense]
MTETFATTLDYGDPSWRQRSRLIAVLPRDHRLIDELRQFVRVLRGLRGESLVLIDSSTGRFQPDFLATAVLGLCVPARRRPAVVMYGDLWQPDGGLRGLVERFLVRSADKTVVRYAALSTDEIEVFPQTWGVGAGKVRFTPYFATLTDEDLSAPAPPVGDYVFAGGNSHRDYAALVDAARLLPDRRFVIATHLLQHQELPANVTAAPVPHAEFVRLLRGAHTVVVPLVAGLCRSTGHQTYLNAMLLGKPTIVTDTLGVADHVRAGETALVVPGTAEAYAEAISWTFDPANAAAVEAMGAAARSDVAARFTFANHVRALLAVVDEAAELVG